MRRRIIIAVVALGLASCARGPLSDYAIDAVELRSAPRLEFLRAQDGMKFLQVLFEFHNGSGEDLVLRATDFALRDADGRVYPFSAQVLDMGQPFHTAASRLEAGERRPGSVVFQIPRRAVPAEMIYRQDVEGGLAVSLGVSD